MTDEERKKNQENIKYYEEWKKSQELCKKMDSKFEEKLKNMTEEELQKEIATLNKELEKAKSRKPNFFKEFLELEIGGIWPLWVSRLKSEDRKTDIENLEEKIDRANKELITKKVKK